jgi:peptidoglycan/xylan/chitin deacetylase (PgdA/CDA1 family)
MPSHGVTVFVKASFGLQALAAAAIPFAPDRWPMSLFVIAVNQLAITYGGVWPTSRLLGANIVRLPGPTKGRVGLTFDDGPDPDVTPQVLDLLDFYRATASFFFIGRKVEAHPDLARLVVRRGHAVENHSYGHPNTFAFNGPRGLRREVGRAQEAIERATGARPAYFRAPVGIRNLWLEPCLAEAGLRLVSWTRRGFDTVMRDPERVARRLGASAREGEILLLHDGGSAKDRTGRPVVLSALPRLLEVLAERSLRAVALPRPGAAS